MRKKDFATIASVISWIRKIDWVIDNEQASTGIDVCDKIAGELASEFARYYPQFKRSKFLDACGIKGAS